MESTITTTTYEASWQIAPTSTLAGIILGLLFFYMIFRHFMLGLMLTDLLLGWLRKFNWFPKEGKRKKTLVHWVIAWALLLGFLFFSSTIGWLEFIPT